MNDVSKQINNKLARLSPEDFEFAIKLITLITVPEFWAEFLALKPYRVFITDSSYGHSIFFAYAYFSVKY